MSSLCKEREISIASHAAAAKTPRRNAWPIVDLSATQHRGGYEEYH